jgi:hypothetical protein
MWGFFMPDLIQPILGKYRLFGKRCDDILDETATNYQSFFSYRSAIKRLNTTLASVFSNND